MSLENYFQACVFIIGSATALVFFLLLALAIKHLCLEILKTSGGKE